jgi:phospholipase/lecithinase/hemolysin
MYALYRYLTPLMLALALMTMSSVPAWAGQEQNRLVIFGDSLSDPGNFFIAYGQVSQAPFAPIPDAPYDVGAGHHFTDGKTWAERLAAELDTPSSGLPALARPGEFTNYAVGRARARPNAPAFAAYDLSTQVSLYLADFRGHATSNAIYIIWIGGNDLDDALHALATDPTGATSAAIAQTAIAAVAANVQVLWSAGARTFLIPNLPDLGAAPAVRALGPSAVAAASQLTGLYNAGLQQALSQLQVLPQIQFVQFDVNSLLRGVIAYPRAFDLDDVVDACLTFFTTADPICAHPRRHLFWDGIHPTVAGHEILEAAAQELIECKVKPQFPRCEK